MEEDNVFIVLGHGSENFIEFDERPILPKGYTLVLFTECGRVTYVQSTVLSVIKSFSEPSNKDILASPDDTTLNNLFPGSPPHIIHEGERYPDLWCQFFLDWPTNSRDKLNAITSGVYKFPLQGTASNYTKYHTLDVVPGTLQYFDKDNIEPVKSLYKGSIFPSAEHIDSILSDRRGRYIREFRNKMYFSLSEIFKIGGPGIYYWPICRGLKNVVHIDHYKTYLNTLHNNNNNNGNNIIKKIKNRYSPYIHEKHLEHPNNIKSLLNEDMKNERIPNHFKKTYIPNFKKKYTNATIKLARIRRASINQRNRTKK